jgi:hypothetical protein
VKLCTKCNVTKDFSLFHKDKTHKDGLRSFCKECVTSYQAKYYVDNKQVIKERVYDWIENNRDRHNAKCYRWVSANKAKVNARTARRYASRTKATPEWVKSNPDYMWMFTEAYSLAKLRETMVGGKWEVDHIAPIRGKTVCGLHVPWNIQVIQQSENRRKSNIF